MFDTELKYFISHQDELVAKHKGQTLVLRGESVEGAYDSVVLQFEKAGLVLVDLSPFTRAVKSKEAVRRALIDVLQHLGIHAAVYVVMNQVMAAARYRALAARFLVVVAHAATSDRLSKRLIISSKLHT